MIVVCFKFIHSPVEQISTTVWSTVYDLAARYRLSFTQTGHRALRVLFFWASLCVSANALFVMNPTLFEITEDSLQLFVDARTCLLPPLPPFSFNLKWQSLQEWYTETHPWRFLYFYTSNSGFWPRVRCAYPPEKCFHSVVHPTHHSPLYIAVVSRILSTRKRKHRRIKVDTGVLLRYTKTHPKLPGDLKWAYTIFRISGLPAVSRIFFTLLQRFLQKGSKYRTSE